MSAGAGPSSPEALAEAFFAAINAGDLEAAIELWLDDALFVPAGAPAIRGKEAIRGILETLIENATQISAEDVVTDMVGAIALRRGRLRLSGRPPGGDPFETVSTFVAVYVSVGENWRIAIDAPAGLGDPSGA